MEHFRVTESSPGLLCLRQYSSCSLKRTGSVQSTRPRQLALQENLALKRYDKINFWSCYLPHPFFLFCPFKQALCSPPLTRLVGALPDFCPCFSGKRRLQEKGNLNPTWRKRLETKASVALNESGFSGWEKERPSCPFCSQGWHPGNVCQGAGRLGHQEAGSWVEPSSLAEDAEPQARPGQGSHVTLKEAPRAGRTGLRLVDVAITCRVEAPRGPFTPALRKTPEPRRLLGKEPRAKPGAPSNGRVELRGQRSV